MFKHRQLPIAALIALAFPLLLTACGSGDDNPPPLPVDPAAPFKLKPEFLSAEPLRTDYDGSSNGLLTGKAASLTELLSYKLPASPSPADLRTLAIQTSYTGLLDVTAAGGFGSYYGRISAAGNKGSEYVAVSDDGSGKQNVTMVVTVPSNFDPAKACVVAVPSSGSRPVYGELGTIGEWALNKGCAVALTDKGGGVGIHDLDRDNSFAFDGAVATAGTRKDLTFNANLLGDDLTKFRAANPNRLALKHAHGKQNPEKDWGKYTLQSIKVALYVLNKQFPAASLSPLNTLVIASSISNGGAAVLRAAEQDSEGLIRGVVAGEPQLNLPENAGLTVKRGGVSVPTSAKPLFDYITRAGLYQACATQSAALAPSSAFVIAPFAANRCASLAAQGLVSGSSLAEQSADALAKLHAYGWEAESDLLHDSHYGFEFTELVAHTYANAFARASVTESVCGYSVAGIDAAYQTPVAPAAEAFKTGWATGGGLGFLGGAFNIIADGSVGGPALFLLAASPSSGKPDFYLDGATCLRRLATGAAVGSSPYSAAEQALAARVKTGLSEVRVSGDLRGKPVVIVHGRSDALIPVNHNSRPYAALNKRADASSGLRYYEVTDANHFDALVGMYPKTLVPLHVYTLRALDLMWAKLTTGAALPDSQLVRAKARASASVPLSDAHVPAIAATPAAADSIVITAGAIDVAN
ncbi:3-hydroxybutyrate oligomer hydrolase family protein [Roseateles albus]|uniref:3-hydroxybutyrate oligomer hydrolase family protein n=1 Tax=Roseateles albus TaxID=2987525 RepID=A0ABT5K9C4_9BURK|nr:3-hydroxybutyrate oligomer hydrolase family protein [Roseateles albus]MDC8770512.1 3-hydroxybutyrate oligomer hydrolase family protein [Roseateles albus]